MKLNVILSCLFILATTFSQAQTRIDLMAGISAASNPGNAKLLVNRQNFKEEFLFTMKKVMPQFYAGIKVHQMLNPSFFVEAGLTYTQSTSQYQMEYTLTPSTHVMTENDRTIQLPVSIGVNLGIVEITSGLMGLYSLSKKSELDEMPGLVSAPDAFHMGWSTAVKVNVMKAQIGIEFQGQFNRVCQGMYVNGQSMELNNVPGKFVFLIQYRIL